MDGRQDIEVRDDDHVRGARDARVTIVEYADVECPYCGRAERLLQRLLQERPDVRLVYRHFPLVEVHPHAYSGALALEAAAAAGRFWELHNVLFARQDALGRRHLAAYADELGLDPASLLRPASEVYDGRVRADFAGGVALGVDGTPGLFVNGCRTDATSWSRLRAAVDVAAQG